MAGTAHKTNNSRSKMWENGMDDEAIKKKMVKSFSLDEETVDIPASHMKLYIM